MRLENLFAVIKFIKKLHCSIIIIESNKSNNNIIKRLLSHDSSITYKYIKDEDVVFYRTHFINMALELVTTPFVAIWDADVIVNSRQIEESIEVLRKKEYEISFPYNGDFLNTDSVFREKYLKTLDINILLRYKKYMNALYKKNFVGGGFIINKEKYILAGKENEEFYGWGPEDLDRIIRWRNMGYRIYRSKGPMFHLCHPRDINGTMRSSIHYNLCMLQLSNSKYSSQYEIKDNI